MTDESHHYDGGNVTIIGAQILDEVIISHINFNTRYSLINQYKILFYIILEISFAQ